jgi:hypothetical protein
MHLVADSIVLSVRAHGEHGAVVRGFTRQAGVWPGYVRGGHSRRLRPILQPANLVRRAQPRLLVLRQRDAGSSARGDALAEFPGHMQGHWLFGLGWGRPEFVDPATAFEVNFVANSPLLTVYRGGIFTGLAFTAILVAGAVVGYRMLRSGRWELGFYGGTFIGFSVVALQLDFPVVSNPSTTTAFSVMLAFVVYAWEKTSETKPDGDNVEGTKTKSLLSAGGSRPAVS